MDIKKVLLITIIAVAIIASVSAVSAGWFDGLFGEQQKDNVIEIDNITFNTTNITKFELYNESEGYRWYMDENHTGYNVHIIYLDEFDDIFTTLQNENVPTQTINGIVVYTTTANTGEHAGEPRYVAYVQNKDWNAFVDVWSPDPNETAKMASTLKFK